MIGPSLPQYVHSPVFGSGGFCPRFFRLAIVTNDIVAGRMTDEWGRSLGAHVAAAGKRLYTGQFVIGVRDRVSDLE